MNICTFYIGLISFVGGTEIYFKKISFQWQIDPSTETYMKIIVQFWKCKLFLKWKVL